MSTRGHRSSISQKSMSHFLSDTDELSDQELIRQVNELKHNIKILTLENEIFEKTIRRLEPSLMSGIQQALEFATKLQSSSSLNVGSFVKSKSSTFGLLDSSSPSRLLTSPSRISTRKLESIGRVGGTIIFGTGPRINVLERAELVANELELLMQHLDNVKRKAAKQQAMLKAQLEEICVRVSDVDKSVASFQQEVIVDGWDEIAQRIPAEIWIRYMTEWVKLCDAQIGKLRLRTSTLNTQFSKLRGQIKLKAELSENLRPVDFEKLKIENNECLKAIDQKLKQLEELKKMTGDANLNLTIHNKAMIGQNSYLTNVIKTTKSKNVQTITIDKERIVIGVEADSLAHRLEEVRKVRLAFLIPDIMEYVGVKAEVADLKHSIKVLDNRLHIQKIALQSLNKKMQAMVFADKL